MKFFDLTQPIWLKIGKLGNIFLLSVLWVISSIPIVSVGVATVALNKKIRDVLFFDFNKNLVFDYFKVMRKTWKIATKLWLIELVSFLVILLEVMFFINLQEKSVSIITLFFVIAVIIVIVLVSILPHLIVTGEESCKQLFLEAISLMIKYFPICIMLLLLEGIIIVFIASEALWYFPFLPGTISVVQVLWMEKIRKWEKIV